MCGRYALGIRASFVRYQLEQQGLPVDQAPDDDEARETYNFPPGAYGLVYRADIPDHGVRDAGETAAADDAPADDQPAPAPAATDTPAAPSSSPPRGDGEAKAYKYQLKVMKWGLIPFWTKRSPDYASMLRTINCRDDSLMENRGLWNTMKQRKRCVVVAQGFYEWLKKGPGGKEKIPHFVKRKDGHLMCFAGLWDCVKYEDAEDKLYTYTIITTDSNKQLHFLHNRMPVILDPGTEAMSSWLDPTRNKWSRELQSILKPYAGELECYPVDAAVGKVGNNSPSFIVPVDSKENKKNIANFFGNAQKPKPKVEDTDPSEPRVTVDHDAGENKAPLPVPAAAGTSPHGEKRPRDVESGGSPDKKQAKLAASPPPARSPGKAAGGRKPKSATSNKDMTLKKSPSKVEPGTQRITNFFAR